MKKRKLAAWIFFVFIIFGSILSANAHTCTYYVSNSGNNSNNGISESTPWKTIAYLNSKTILPGQTVCFKRGDTWRFPTDAYLIVRSGNASGGYVTYTSYGSGPKPRFLGSVQKNNSMDWTLKSGHIWTTTISQRRDVGNLIFNNEEFTGSKVWNEADLDTEGEFWYDYVNGILELYSANGNPASTYSSIECSLYGDMINESGESYVIYEDLHLSYGGSHGIGGSSVDHLIIRNSDFSFIGGSQQYGNVRYGNAIEFWDNANDTLVEGCRIWDIYDAALTTQGYGNGNQKINQIFRNNVIWNSRFCFEYWNLPETSITGDIYFENNTCAYSADDLMFYPNTAYTYNFYVRNNIFYEPTEANGFLVINSNTGFYSSDYNAWYRTNGVRFCNNYDCAENPSKGRFSYTFPQYQTLSGQDLHSMEILPNFVDATNNDYRPIIGSPICTMSMTGSYIGALECVFDDICPNPPPIVISNTGYNSIQDAYSSAMEGDLIKSHAGFTSYENPELNMYKSVVMDGNYNCDFTVSSAGITTIKGQIRIQHGTVKLRNYRIAKQ